MLDVTPFRPVVIACLADPAVLDAAAFDGGVVGRVAPDELLWIVEGGGDDALEHATAVVAAADAAALVVDQSAGWAGYTLAGDDYGEAHARLSAVRLPNARPAFVQGAFASLAAKLVVLPNAIQVLVASTVAHHLHHRIVDASRGLGIRETTVEAAAGLAATATGAAQ